MVVMAKHSVDKSRSRYGDYVTLRFHKPEKVYNLTWGPSVEMVPRLIAKFTETDGDYAMQLWWVLEQLCQDNIELQHKNKLLTDELEECKAVIDNRWSEYLKKKEKE